MLKKTITYRDYNDTERTEDFYFNLSKAEIMEMELSTVGGLAEMIQKVVATQDAPAIIKIFKDLILKAYGEKSADGRRFMKEDESGRKLYKDFEQTEAYVVLFTELATNADSAAAFVNGIVPADMSKNAVKALPKN
jgi:hypothetical protein